MGRGLLVVEPGLSSLVQDGGRPGLADLGVARSGAADRLSYADANALVGNLPGAAVVEHLLGGLTLQAVGDHWVAVSGAPVPASVNGTRRAHRTVIRMRDGDRLTLGTASSGLRSYVAVRGGVATETVLGSRSTDTLSGLGPPPLQAGQLVPIGPIRQGPLTSYTCFPGGVPSCVAVTTSPVMLHAIVGPRDGWVPHAARLGDGVWQATPNSSRVALRLARQALDGVASDLAWSATREPASEGIVRGCVQLPPSGLPVLFLADHPVTGGYPVIAVVLDADTDRAAQVRPGQLVQFQFVPSGLERL